MKLEKRCKISDCPLDHCPAGHHVYEVRGRVSTDDCEASCFEHADYNEALEEIRAAERAAGWDPNP